jgi:hypothetical protein
MAHITEDRVRETTTTTGTGVLALAGAVAGFRTFAAVLATSDTVWYAIVHQTANEWEVGLGTYSAANQLTRTTVLESSNANALVAFSAGTKDVFLTAPAARLAQLDHESAIPLPLVTADPPAVPPANTGKFYLRARAGCILPSFVGPSGVDTALQPSLWANRTMLVLPGSGTGLGSFGLTPTTGATLSHPTPATTSIGESLYRTRFATSGTAGNASGWRDAVNTFWRGNAAGAGGFFHHFRVTSGSIGLAGGQVIVGLSSSTGALAGEPSALADVLGIGFDAADTNWQFMRRTGTGTVQKVSLGIAKATLNRLLDLWLYSAPNGSGIGVRVLETTGFAAATVLLDTTYTTDIPASATLLGRHCQVRNGVTASAANVDHVRTYSFSDF